MGLFFQLLASGSKGNSVLVSTGKTSVLLDAGLSGKELVSRLARTSVSADKLDALLISHEHQDHVLGAGPLSRRFNLPVYLSRGTMDNLPPKVGRFPHTHLFQLGVPFAIGDLRIQPFAISHDAGEPSGFVMEHGGVRLGVCTDLGVATNLVKTRLQGCQGLVIEANHDVARLMDGPYPPPLKQRIRSRHGHLSNSEACELLEELHHSDLKAVVFAHLSEVNNTPALVRECLGTLRKNPIWDDISFDIGRQSEVTDPVQLP